MMIIFLVYYHGDMMFDWSSKGILSVSFLCCDCDELSALVCCNYRKLDYIFSTSSLG